VNLVWSAPVIIVVTAAVVPVMLLVRRGAPDGSRFQDGDRASGVFGVLSTGFACHARVRQCASAPLGTD
jgi:hypothetical protein